jgi:phage-related protein
VSIALGTVYGDLRLKLDALKADGDKALAIFSDLRTKLGELGTAAGEAGTKLNEAGTKAEEASTKVGHVGTKAKEAGFSLKEATTHLLEFTGAMIGMNLIFGVFDKLAESIHGVFERASEDQVVMQEMNTLLETTKGKAGMTAEALENYAVALSDTTAFSKETVMHTQNLLLTFTNIGQKVFPDATQSALNMAQVLGIDTKNAAIMLGKALNDPVKGATALRRVGVSLDEQQMKHIKTLMAQGKLYEAQQIILGELHTEFGKQAQDYGKTLPGAIAVLRNNFNNLADNLSGKLIPKLTDLVVKITPIVLGFMRHIPEALDKAGKAFDDIRGKVEAVADFITTHEAVFDALKLAILTVGGALLWAAITAIPTLLIAIGEAIVGFVALDAVTAPFTLPVLAVAAAIALLVFGFKQLYDHTDAFRGLINGFLPALQQVGGIIKGLLQPVVDQLGDTFKNQLVPAWKSLEPTLQQLLPALQAVGVFLGAVLVVDLGILIGFLTGAVKGFVGLLSGVIRVIGGIVQVFTGVIQIIVGLFTGIVNIITDIVTGRFDKIGPHILQMLQALGSGIVNILSGLWNIIAGIFQGAIGLVWGLISGFVQGIIGFFTTLWDKLVGHSIIPDMITGIINWFLKLPIQALQAIGKFELAVLGAMADLAGKMLDAGKNLIQQLINGIASMAGKVKDTVGNIAGGIKNLIGWKSPTKEGPGADSHTWAPNLMSMLATGIDEGTPKVARAAGRAALAIRGGLLGDMTGTGLGGLPLSGTSLAAGVLAGPGGHHFHYTTNNIEFAVEVTPEATDSGDPAVQGRHFGHGVGTVLGQILSQRGY